MTLNVEKCNGMECTRCSKCLASSFMHPSLRFGQSILIAFFLLK